MREGTEAGPASAVGGGRASRQGHDHGGWVSGHTAQASGRAGLPHALPVARRPHCGLRQPEAPPSNSRGDRAGLQHRELCKVLRETCTKAKQYHFQEFILKMINNTEKTLSVGKKRQTGLV